MKFIDTIKNVWKITELKDRILFTMGMLLVYRFGAQIAIPGIDGAQLALDQEFQTQTSEGIIGLLNACCTIDGHCYSISSKTSKRRS